MKEKEYAEIMFLCVSIVCALAGILYRNVVLAAIASFISVFGLFVYKCWDILEAIIVRKTGVIYSFGGYELSGARDAAVSAANGSYHAIAASLITLQGDGGELDRRSMEDIISRFRWPFRLSLYAERMDLKGMTESIETSIERRRIALSRISDTSSSKGAMKAESLRREINHLQEELHNLVSGGVPLKVCYYAITSSSSESRPRAIADAKSRAIHLSGMIDAALHSRSRLLSGEELLRLMSIDSFGVSDAD